MLSGIIRLLCPGFLVMSLLAANGQGLNSPARTVSTIPGSKRMIPVSDGNILRGLSALNWVRTSGAVSTSNGGASLQVCFRGTGRVAMTVDTAGFKFAVPTRCPVIAWTVNGGVLQSHQLAPGETAVDLAEGVADPAIDLYAKGFSPFENRFSGGVPENSVVITGFQVDAGGSTAPVPVPPRHWLNVGDSIMSGDVALYAKGQGRPPDNGWAASDDARASYGYLLAKHYGFSESRLAHGGYAWGGGLARLPALSILIDQITSTVSRLDGDYLKDRPDVVLINLGENGAPTKADVFAALSKIRRRIGTTAKIIVMIPVSGKARPEITVGFQAYKSASHDEQVFMVDLGNVSFDTADGQHPTAAGHEAIFRAALPAFDALALGR